MIFDYQVLFLPFISKNVVNQLELIRHNILNKNALFVNRQTQRVNFNFLFWGLYRILKLCEK